MIGDIITESSEWEEAGWEIVRVVPPRHPPYGIRRWRIAFIQESRRRLYICPEPRDLVETPLWEGWNESKPYP